MSAAIQIDDLHYRYGDRVAVKGVSLAIRPAEIFVLLGPNGSGKSTMFRILSTLVPPQQGNITVLGRDIRGDVQKVRESIGVVFQSPSVDIKLTVAENLQQQAALYGLSKSDARNRCSELLDQLGLKDRVHERVQTLSGGLRRRVELAKGMLHRPQVLLMDEPSTGLDPGARNEVWSYLVQMRDQFQVTIALTTHLLEEAQKADRIAILDEGKLVALDTPSALCNALGGDSISIETENPAEFAAQLGEKFSIEPYLVDGMVRFEQEEGQTWVPRIIEAFPGKVKSIRLGEPTLEDVFVQRTGHAFWHAAPSVPAPKTQRKKR